MCASRETVETGSQEDTQRPGVSRSGRAYRSLGSESGSTAERPGHAAVDEMALRTGIGEKMAAGILPRTPPPVMWAGLSSWKRKTCAVCDEPIVEGEMEIEYLVHCNPIYFHPRCDELWREACS